MKTCVAVCDAVCVVEFVAVRVEVCVAVLTARQGP